jgi:hypothetical protein
MKTVISKLMEKIRGVFSVILDKIKSIIKWDDICRFSVDAFEQFQHSDIYVRVHTSYLHLGEKEKKLANAGLAIAGIIFLIMMVYPFVSHLGTKAESIEKAGRVLEDMKHVGRTFQESKSAVSALKRKFKSDPNFKAAPFVEKIASEVGIKKIDSFNAKAPQKKDFLVIKKYVVKLSKIHLRNVVDFIYKIENSRVPFFVTSLKLSRLFSNIKYFNLDLVISYKEFKEAGKNEK